MASALCVVPIHNHVVPLDGFYDIWNDEVLSCAILTTTPNALMAALHDRLPDEYDRWLDPGITDPAEIQTLPRPYPGEMRAYPVSSTVNSPRDNTADLLQRA